MRTVLAQIKLTSGNVGWYDPLTNIHLTMQKPDALVYEGMNTKNLKQGVQYKTIAVTSGSLNGPLETAIPTKTVQPIPEIAVVEEIKAIEEIPAVEEVQPEIEEIVPELETQEEIVQPEKKKSTRSKKK